MSMLQTSTTSSTGYLLNNLAVHCSALTNNREHVMLHKVMANRIFILSLLIMRPDERMAANRLLLLLRSLVNWFNLLANSTHTVSINWATHIHSLIKSDYGNTTTKSVSLKQRQMMITGLFMFNCACIHVHWLAVVDVVVQFAGHHSNKSLTTKSPMATMQSVSSLIPHHIYISRNL